MNLRLGEVLMTQFPYGESLEELTIDRGGYTCLVIRHVVDRTLHSYRLRVGTACQDGFETDTNSYDEARALMSNGVPTCVRCAVAELDERTKYVARVYVQLRTRT